MGMHLSQALVTRFRRLAGSLVAAILAATLAGSAVAAPTAPQARDPAYLLVLVNANILAAENATLRYLLSVPVDGLYVAQAYLDNAHFAVDLARDAVAALSVLDPAAGPGPPGGCCDDLADEIDRYEQRLDDLAAVVERRGDATSGLIWEAHATMNRLDAYLSGLGADAPSASPPSARADAIRAIRTDLDAIRRYEAEYLLYNGLENIANIRKKIHEQENASETGAIDTRERARVLAHLRTYALYLEQIALADFEASDARHQSEDSARLIRNLVDTYLIAVNAPAPGRPTV